MATLDSNALRIYRSMMASHRVMVCFLAPDGTVKFANDAFCRYWGLDPDSVPGTDYASIFAIDEQDDIRRRINATMARPHDTVVEHPVKMRDGRKDWHECELRPIRTVRDELDGLLIISRESTERRRVETEAVKNKARLDDVQRLARLGSWEWDIRTNKVTMSESLSRILGIEPERRIVTYERFVEIVHPEDRAEVHQQLQHTIETGVDYTVDHRVICRDGSLRYLKGAGQVQSDESGEPIRVIGMSQDVTDETHAVKALQASEARVRAIIDATVDAIVTINEESEIQSFNLSAERIFGYKADEVIGKKVAVLMPPPFRDEHEGYVRNYLESGNKKIIGIGREVVGRRKDGGLFPLELAVSEVDVDGQKIFTGVVRDISERRRMEQEILRISELERRRIGQDLHDGLGQMLTGIGLISQNVARKLRANDLEGAEDVAEIAELIRAADVQARGLAKGLVPVEVEAQGLAAALRQLARNAERLFGIRCTFREYGIASHHDSNVITHVYRIAQEAVSNAVKHGRASEVNITLAWGADQWRLRVRDNGVGFPEKLDGTTGMGVNIMHYRARIIEGNLDIRRGGRGGTVVTCTIPVTVRMTLSESRNTPDENL